jgi:membrane-associated phospholipid phosphatase
LLFGLLVVAGFGLWRGGFRRAVVAPSVLGVSIVVVELLKYVILPRPRLYASARWLRYPSFPSGHTTIAVGLAAAALFVATDRTRRAVHLGGFVYASLMGLSLIVTANHRLSDEIGSCLVVYLAAQVAAMVLPTTTIRPASGPSIRRTALTCVAIIGAAAVFGGFLTRHGGVTVALECVAYLAVCRATLRRISALT